MVDGSSRVLGCSLGSPRPQHLTKGPPNLCTPRATTGGAWGLEGQVRRVWQGQEDWADFPDGLRDDSGQNWMCKGRTGFPNGQGDPDHVWLELQQCGRERQVQEEWTDVPGGAQGDSGPVHQQCGQDSRVWQVQRGWTDFSSGLTFPVDCTALKKSGGCVSRMGTGGGSVKSKRGGLGRKSISSRIALHHLVPHPPPLLIVSGGPEGCGGGGIVGGTEEFFWGGIYSFFS